MNECELCRKEHRTEWYPITEEEAKICWIAKCRTHRDTWMIVANKHGPLAEEEDKKIREIAQKYFSGCKLRPPQSILDHAHYHVLLL